MKILGFATKKGELRYSVLEGTTKDDCKIATSVKLNFNPEMLATDLMNTFESIFIEVIDIYAPDKIAFKQSLNLDLNQMDYMAYPYGILNLICYHKGIPITQRSSSWISSTSNKVKRVELCKSRFSGYKANLSGIELESISVAWFEFQ